MAGITAKGLPTRANTDPANFAADLTELAEDATGLIGETVASVTNLPAGGNWLNRTIMTEDTKILYVWRGSAWLAVTQTTVPFNTVTAADATFTVTHNLGVIPRGFQISLQNTGVDAVTLIMSVIVWDSITATSVKLRARRSDTNNWLSANTVRGYLTAIA